MTTKTLNYQTTPIKPVNAKAAKRYAMKDMDAYSTPAILWFIAKRHSHALVTAWAIVITVLYIFPPAVDVVLSIF